jgi:hypothetical protein
MVRVHPDPPGCAAQLAARGLGKQAGRGAVAQLGEHLLCKQGVVGSIPISSTIYVGIREIKPKPRGLVLVSWTSGYRLFFNNTEEVNAHDEVCRVLGWIVSSPSAPVSSGTDG